MLIELKGVSKIYDSGETKYCALDHISLKIQKGEFISIIGQSGSGKSTLMNIIGCLDTPTEGSYFINGKNVSSLTDNELSVIRNQKIGFIFQKFNLIPNLNAIENIELPLIYRGIEKNEREAISYSALAKVGLENYSLHKPSEMSGGQQQRVAIARAIASAPPIILADEPTGNLDTKSGMEIMNILITLHQEGHTIILITHDHDIASTANRIIRIKDGQIEQDYKNIVSYNSQQYILKNKINNKEKDFNEFLKQYIEWKA